MRKNSTATEILDKRTLDRKTRDTRTRRDKSYWYINQTQQNKRINEVLAETGWEVNQSELSELRMHKMSPDGGLVVSSLILPAKDGKDSFHVTFWEFARYLEKNDILKIDFSNKWGCNNVHLLDYLRYTDGIRLVSIKLDNNRGYSVIDSLGKMEDSRMPASLELLWMLIVFPRFAEAIRNGDVLPFNLSGCCIGDDIVEPKKSVVIGPVDNQEELVLRAGNILYFGPDWTSPTFWEF